MDGMKGLPKNINNKNIYIYIYGSFQVKSAILLIFYRLPSSFFMTISQFTYYNKKN